MSLAIRIIPCLLLKEWGIVKTVRFDEETYIGCPINAVRVFNANNVDELILLDILATPKGRGIFTEILTQITDESFMPITVGGGIRKQDDIREMLQHGADKIAINTAAVDDPGCIKAASAKFGRQCIVVSIDVRRTEGNVGEVFTQRGRKPTGLDPVDHAIHMEELGAGEILLNSIDRDGTWDGYDVDLIRRVSEAVSIPVVACGGAGELQHFADAVDIGGASAVCAGSFFLFHGSRRGILINFPSRNQLSSVLGKHRVRP
ncbi:MAG: AglZ/HisF2 family acetamidino modification protein [Pirellulaceae bacterium]|nr:imidazole glycerol phosphate synthase subunit HisF [Planctomycetaceae bacterium]